MDKTKNKIPKKEMLTNHVSGNPNTGLATRAATGAKTTQMSAKDTNNTFT